MATTTRPRIRLDLDADHAYQLAGDLFRAAAILAEQPYEHRSDLAPRIHELAHQLAAAYAHAVPLDQ